jgi:hypothetical protein
MQNNDNEYESTEEYSETSKPSGNGLRAQLEAVLAEKRELEAKYQEAQKDLRNRSIQETLASIGVNARVAQFIPSNVNDKDSILQWVTDNADVFNIQIGGNQAVAPQATVDPSIVASSARLNNLSSAAQSPSKIQDIEARIAGATTKAELESLWAEARAYLL